MFGGKKLGAGRKEAGRGLLAGVLAVAFGGFMFAAAQAPDLTQSPPGEPWAGVDSLVELPAFVPGAGELFIRPDDAPFGPWLAYGSDGSLVEVLFMVPVSEMEQHGSWDDLAGDLLAGIGLTIDHVDITYNGGHPGMAEPHYHFRIAFVDHATQGQLLSE